MTDRIQGEPRGKQPDYRLSHVGRGPDYDRNLGQGDFDTYMTVREHALLERLLAKHFPGGVPRYLDFACGTGRITQFVESKADEAHGIDLSPEMVDQARRRCRRTTFRIGDLTRERLELGTFQLVTAFRFFGNAQDELRRDALRAIHRHLAPGGYLILNNHRNRWSLHGLLRLARRQPPDGDLSYRRLRRLLRESGFQLVKTYGVGWWLLRHSWNRPEVMASRAVRWAEALSYLWPLGPLSPDLVVVARRPLSRDNSQAV
jgi:SAM-dependent methyltransferase